VINWRVDVLMKYTKIQILPQADGLNFAKEMLLSTAESATYSASEVERRLHSNLRNGLTWQEALSRSKIIGFNELQAPEEDSTLKKYVEQFKNPLILLLLGEFCSRDTLPNVTYDIYFSFRICTRFYYHATI
jgi:magnesium-transporting ATPase (P-type)